MTGGTCHRAGRLPPWRRSLLFLLRFQPEQQTALATFFAVSLLCCQKACFFKITDSAAHGVRAIKLRDGDSVVSMARAREGATVLTVSDKGLGRRCSLDAYARQGRGGFGRKNYTVSEEKGYVCGIKVVDEDDDIIMISTDGVVIRLRASDIRVMGRYATGVRMMKVNENERVVTFTRAEHDENAEIAQIEQPSEEELAQQEALAREAEKAEAAEPEVSPEEDGEEETEE